MKSASQKHYDKYKRDQEAKHFYKSKEWQACRMMAAIRDNFLCQECLKKRKIITYNVVHHIKPRKEYPELALDLDNLICLCHKCHNKKHPEKGKRKKENENLKIDVISFEANEELI